MIIEDSVIMSSIHYNLGHFSFLNSNFGRIHILFVPFFFLLVDEKVLIYYIKDDQQFPLMKR